MSDPTNPRQLRVPRFVAADMSAQFGATKPVLDGAMGVVWLVTLPDDDPRRVLR